MEGRIAMNVYDFDHTIYAGDCTVDFWIYCLRRFPVILKTLPATMFYAGLFICKLCSKEDFKEKFYAFLPMLPDVKNEVESFWDGHMYRIKSFYRKQATKCDLVISASPEFLIAEACSRLKIAYIASKVNPLTGKLEGKNCWGEEKWTRFQNEYPDEEIDEFYSDSDSDRYLAQKARKAYLVKKTTIKEWK